MKPNANSMGRESFEAEFNVDLAAIAADLVKEVP